MHALALLLALQGKHNPSLSLQVVSLCQEAALCAMHEDINVAAVSARHFQQALLVVKPQTDPSTLEFYENYHCMVGIKETT